MAKTVDNFATIEDFRKQYNELAYDVGEIDGLNDALKLGSNDTIVDAINVLDNKQFFLQEFNYIATLNQTTFTGLDSFDNGLIYKKDHIQVFKNERHLVEDVDYVVGSSDGQGSHQAVILQGTYASGQANAMAANDRLTIYSYTGAFIGTEIAGSASTFFQKNVDNTIYNTNANGVILNGDIVSATTELEDSDDYTLQLAGKTFAEDSIVATAAGSKFQAPTLSDGIASLSSGSLTGVVNITASGTIQAEQLTSTDDLTVTDDASIGGDLGVTGTATVGTLTDGTLSITGGDITSVDDITGAAGSVFTAGSFVGDLTGDVTGVTGTFTGTVQAEQLTTTDDLQVGDDLTVVDDASIGGILGVTGNTTVGGTLGVTSNTTVGGTLGVTSNTTVGGTLGVTGTTTLTGALVANGNVDLGNAISDTITFVGTVDSNITPNTHNTQQVGISTRKFTAMHATTFNGALTGNASGTAGSISNHNLSGLSDVNYTTTPSTGQILVWDNGNSYWEPADQNTSDSVAEGSNNLYYTDARVSTRVGTILQHGNHTNITATTVGAEVRLSAAATYGNSDVQSYLSGGAGLAMSGAGAFSVNTSNGVKIDGDDVELDYSVITDGDLTGGLPSGSGKSVGHLYFLI